MHFKRLAASVAVALMVLAPGVQAAPLKQDAKVRYALLALSNNCQYRDEAGCVNVALTIDYDSAGRGRLCISTQDNRDGGPPSAAGCADSYAVSMIGGTITVPKMVVPSTLASDCPPGEACPAEMVNVTVAASFVQVGKSTRQATTETTLVGRCRTTTVTTRTRTDVVGTVTVDRTTYSLPGADPLAHHRSAEIVRQTVRLSADCRGGARA